MKSILNIFQIWYREIGNIFRDKGIMIFILFVPLAYPLLYSYVYTNEVVREVPVAVVDESHSELSRELLRKMDASPDMKIVAYCDNLSAAQEMIRRQEVYGIVRIPSDFTRELWKGNQAPIGLYCDMSSMLYYKALLLTATNVSLEVNKDIKVNHYLPSTTDRQAEITRMPIDYDYVPLYNPQSGFAAFLIPPVLMLIIQQTLLLGIGMSTGNSREHHMGSVIPFHPWYKNPVHIVIGKALPYFMLYIILGVYMFAVVTRLFTLPQLGHYTTFIAFLVPFVLACIFLAMVLSSFIYRREDSILLLVFLSVPMLFLSGLSWPASDMPAFWKYFSYLFPSTFGMNGYVRITSSGARLSDISSEYIALWIQAGVYFLLACWFYRRQIKCILTRKREESRCDN
jgi:ABC-2 type transport system permease protein